MAATANIEKILKSRSRAELAANSITATEVAAERAALTTDINGTTATALRRRMVVELVACAFRSGRKYTAPDAIGEAQAIRLSAAGAGHMEVAAAAFGSFSEDEATYFTRAWAVERAEAMLEG